MNFWWLHVIFGPPLPGLSGIPPFKESYVSAFYESLVVLLTTKLGISHDDVNPNATFEELDMDSLALVELTDILDAEYGISIEEGAVGKQTTLADVAKVLENHLADPR